MPSPRRRSAPTGRASSPRAADQTARVWDARTGAELLTLKGHTGRVTSASFSPDGSRVVTASADETARVWDAPDRRRAPHPQGAHRSGHRRRRSAPTARASSPRARTGRRRSGTPRPGPRSSPSRGTPVAVTSASFSPDGSRVVTGELRQDGEGLGRRRPAPSSSPSRGTPSPVISASFSPDGSRIVTTSTLTSNTLALEITMKVWDASPISREFLPKAFPLPTPALK